MGVVTAAKARTALLRSMIGRRGRPAARVGLSDRLALVEMIDSRTRAVGVVNALDEAAGRYGISRSTIARIYYASRDQTRPILRRLARLQQDLDELGALFEDFPALRGLADRLESVLQDDSRPTATAREMKALADLLESGLVWEWARRYARHPLQTGFEVQRAIDKHLRRHPLPNS